MQCHLQILADVKGGKIDQDYKITAGVHNVSFLWNYTEGHWTTVFVTDIQDAAKRKYFLYNSWYATKGPTVSKLREHIKSLDSVLALCNGWPEVKEPWIYLPKTDEQQDGCDCGVHAVYNATRLSMGLNATTSGRSGITLRKKMLDFVRSFLVNQLTGEQHVQYDAVMGSRAGMRNEFDNSGNGNNSGGDNNDQDEERGDSDNNAGNEGDTIRLGHGSRSSLCPRWHGSSKLGRAGYIRRHQGYGLS